MTEVSRLRYTGPCAWTSGHTHTKNAFLIRTHNAELQRRLLQGAYSGLKTELKTRCWKSAQNPSPLAEATKRRETLHCWLWLTVTHFASCWWVCCFFFLIPLVSSLMGRFPPQVGSAVSLVSTRAHTHAAAAEIPLWKALEPCHYVLVPVFFAGLTR